MRKLTEKGTLLVELLIVIGVLGLLLTISVPYIRNSISNIRLANSAKDIVIYIRNSQQLTVSEQTHYDAEIIDAEQKYKIVKASDNSVIRETGLPSEIIFSEINGFTGDKISFNYYGAAIETGTILLLNTATNKTAVIEVKPSGYVNYSL
ncbi:MAG: hypothetical protein V1655_00970 [bacterium]